MHHYVKIYNCIQWIDIIYKILREYLIEKGVKLKTHSDTEVILELFGLEGSTCFQSLRACLLLLFGIAKKRGFCRKRSIWNSFICRL